MPNGHANLKLTSVKIEESIYKRFKINSVESGITLKEVLNRTLHLFNTNEEFRTTLETLNLEISGSVL